MQEENEGSIRVVTRVRPFCDLSIPKSLPRSNSARCNNGIDVLTGTDDMSKRCVFVENVPSLDESDVNSNECKGIFKLSTFYVVIFKQIFIQY